MNERIRALNEQAFNLVWDLDSNSIGPGTHFAPDGFEQKFAELIVRECAEVLSDKRFDNVRPSMNIAQAMIEQHFGVENDTETEN